MLREKNITIFTYTFLLGLLLIVGSADGYKPLASRAQSDAGQRSVSYVINYNKNCRDFYDESICKNLPGSGFYTPPYLTVMYTGEVRDKNGQPTTPDIKLYSGDKITLDISESSNFGFTGFAWDSPPAFWVDRLGDPVIVNNPEVYNARSEQGFNLYYFMMLTKPREFLTTEGLDCGPLKLTNLTTDSFRNLHTECTVRGDKSPYIDAQFETTEVGDSAIPVLGYMPSGQIIDTYTTGQSGPRETIAWGFQLGVNKPAPAPTLTLTGNPTNITQGENIKLIWNSTDIPPNGCTASNAWSGTKNANGEETVTPTSSGQIKYSLKCAGPGGSVTQDLNITVYPPLTVSCSVSPTKIEPGQSATWQAVASGAGGTDSYSYSWSGNNALRCDGQPSASCVSINKIYESADPSTKSAVVTVTSQGQSINQFCNNNVTVGNPPSTPEPFDFSISNRNDIIINQGESGQSTIATIKDSGSPQPVTLSVTGLPDTVKGDFTHGSNPCVPDRLCVNDFTITTINNTPTGIYPLTIKGTSGSLIKTVSFNLIVNKSTPPITFPPPGVYTSPLEILPTSANILAGDSVSFRVSGGDGNYTWSASSPVNPGSGNGSDFIANFPAAGTFLVTVKSGGQSQNATVNVESRILDFSAKPSSLNPGQYTTLSWNTVGTNSCTIYCSDAQCANKTIVSSKGSKNYFIQQNAANSLTDITFTLTCTDAVDKINTAQTNIKLNKIPKVQEIIPR